METVDKRKLNLLKYILLKKDLYRPKDHHGMDLRMQCFKEILGTFYIGDNLWTFCVDGAM